LSGNPVYGSQSTVLVNVDDSVLIHFTFVLLLLMYE